MTNELMTDDLFQFLHLKTFMIIYTFEYWLARRGLTAIAGTTFIRAILLPAIIIHHFHFHLFALFWSYGFVPDR